MSREAVTRGIPPGICLIRRIRGKDLSFNTYRYVVLLITFIAYTSYHASRKPSSIVKSVLDPQSNANVTSKSDIWPIGDFFVQREFDQDLGKTEEEQGWVPFNGRDGTKKLGEIDVAFLACYSLGMYVAGHLGDSLDLRLFLATGMIGSGVFVALFGLGYFLDFHVFWFYLLMQMLAGLFQATGWPSVVAVIGNWFDKRKRGLIMGVWNAHTSVGNISGSLLAACVLDYGWGWSFVVPGAFIFVAGIIVFFFLPAYPEDIGFPCENGVVPVNGDEEAQPGVENGGRNGNLDRYSSLSRKSIGFVGACLIPGVIPFALCLFFSKMVAYTFLYWLPFYISQTAIGGEYLSVKSAGNLSTLFDVGGIAGGILAGLLSDWFDARATTAASFMYAAIPAMLLYRKFGGISKAMNIFLMFSAGLFVNGPYALITTAVSADLGTHGSLRGDSRALATVTAIIDGTGSLGASLGPFLTGFLSTDGWDNVFTMLTIGAMCAALLLSNLVVNELRGKFFRHREQSSGGPATQPLLRDGR